MPERKRPPKLKPTPPPADVREIQDPEHTESDFLRDLDRASSNRSKELLDDPARPDPRSRKTSADR
jgi:hypothetical protein